MMDKKQVKSDNYREAIYKYYTSKRVTPMTPKSTSALKSRAPYLNQIINRHFPKQKDSKILELGCGHGAFQYFINKAGYTNSIGVDGSPEQVEAAKGLGIENVEYGSIVEYLSGVPDNSIDLIIAFDVIEHFTKTELFLLVQELFRVIKKGGKLISHQPNAEGIFSNFMYGWDYTHEQCFTRQSIGQLYLASGFDEVSSYEDKPCIHGFKSFVRYILWNYLIRVVLQFIRVVETGNGDRNAIFTQNFLSVTKK